MFDTFPCQRLFKHPADGTIVIHDPDSIAHDYSWPVLAAPADQEADLRMLAPLWCIVFSPGTYWQQYRSRCVPERFRPRSFPGVARRKSGRSTGPIHCPVPSGDQWIEQGMPDRFRNSGTVVDHSNANLWRRFRKSLLSCDTGTQDDLAVAIHRLRGIACDVENGLISCSRSPMVCGRLVS